MFIFWLPYETQLSWAGKHYSAIAKIFTILAEKYLYCNYLIVQYCCSMTFKLSWACIANTESYQIRIMLSIYCLRLMVLQYIISSIHKLGSGKWFWKSLSTGFPVKMDNALRNRSLLHPLRLVQPICFIVLLACWVGYGWMCVVCV